ncbi:MAG TPA: hypothetical protein HA252_00450 [Candidatus Diapherotrites archaeon]|uniref:Uncharacterized protein n=1 Tax=Candidatus Iainarchaeum sp. TaxID=3101447 RepID=A0A7J4JDS3_9ARCH|nr:hypothetical protein [Candidatus Diapherotrites archaeon]HIH15858.1 hypothetical protein [Candidatus Diapherotrites archaeon]
MVGECKIAFFDLETEQLFEDLGMESKWSRDPSRLSIACACVKVNEEPCRVFLKEQAKELFDLLQSCDLVVGHNLFSFDYSVLQGAVKQPVANLLNTKTLDMLFEIEKKTSQRVALNDLAKLNLGEEKTEDSRSVPFMWRTGKRQQVIDYCINDVEMTRKLYEFGRDHHKLKYTAKTMDYRRDERIIIGVKEVEVSWQ